MSVLLRGCSEDDTISFERTALTFGNVVFCRSGVGAPEQFFKFLVRFTFIQ